LSFSCFCIGRLGDRLLVMPDHTAATHRKMGSFCYFWDSIICTGPPGEKKFCCPAIPDIMFGGQRVRAGFAPKFWRPAGRTRTPGTRGRSDMQLTSHINGAGDRITIKSVAKLRFGSSVWASLGGSAGKLFSCPSDPLCRKTGYTWTCASHKYTVLFRCAADATRLSHELLFDRSDGC